MFRNKIIEDAEGVAVGRRFGIVLPLLTMEFISNLCIDPEFFLQLPFQSVDSSFVFLQLSSRELPFQRVAGGFLSLTDKDSVVPNQDADGDFLHRGTGGIRR